MHLGNPAKKRCADGSSWVTFPKQVARPSFGKSAPGAMQPRNFGEGPKKWLEARAKGMGSMLKGEKSAGIRWQNHRKNMEKHGDALVVEDFLRTIFAFGQYKSVGFEGTIEPTNPTCRFIIHKYWGAWQGHVHWKRSPFSMIFSLCT